MENLTFAIQDDEAETPLLREDTHISIIDEIEEGSLVTIVPTEVDVVEVRLADPATIGGNKKVNVVTRGEEPNQILLMSAEIETVDLDLSNERLEELYAGFQWYYRDFDLPVELTSRYTRGSIIFERGFTDASKHRGGFAAAHRFLIASPAATDLSDVDETDPERGLCVIQSGSHFRVLDLIDDGDNRQTTLLHMPEFLVEMLRGQNFTEFEQRLISEARLSFDELKSATPVPALTRMDTWIARLASPIGIDDEGRFFY